MTHADDVHWLGCAKLRAQLHGQMFILQPETPALALRQEETSPGSTY
jgi:hypothetical protein